MSALAQVTTLSPPAAPVNVVATANSETKVTVTWSENIPPGGLPIQTYTIFRGTSPTSLTQETVRSASPFVDAAASPNTIYYYAIEATDTGQDVSPMSAPAQVSTPATPAAPVNVGATATSGTGVTVTWSENIPANGLPIKYYTIFRGTSPTGLAQLATRSTTQFVDTGVSANTTYYYAIEAVDTGADVSPASAPAQVATPD
jgi:chitin-binding protein